MQVLGLNLKLLLNDCLEPTNEWEPALVQHQTGRYERVTNVISDGGEDDADDATPSELSAAETTDVEGVSHAHNG